jgi:hypothetical protein
MCKQIITYVNSNVTRADTTPCVKENQIAKLKIINITNNFTLLILLSC